MNCRQLARVLPELVAGELDERTAREAREHIELCPACSAEMAAYEEVLGAAAGPWEVLKAPDDLALVIPERPTLPLGRFGLAAAALALIAVIATTLPGPKKPHAKGAAIADRAFPARKAPIAESPAQKREMATVPAPADQPLRATEGVQAPRPAPRACYQTAYSVPRAYRRRHVKTHRPVWRDLVSVPETKPADTEPAPVAERPVTAMIVASTVPPPAGPPSIAMRSVDEATGQVTVQSVSFDESGKRQESEVTYVPNVTDSWRDNL